MDEIKTSTSDRYVLNMFPLTFTLVPRRRHLVGPSMSVFHGEAIRECLLTGVWPRLRCQGLELRVGVWFIVDFEEHGEAANTAVHCNDCKLVHEGMAKGGT